MNSEKSKTSEPHVLILKLTDKLDLRRGGKNVALSNFSIYYTCKNIKSLYNNNKFNISTPTQNDKFQLPDGSYSASDIQGYFEYILKNLNEKINNPSIRIYANKIENRITFKTITRYYLELLTPGTMKLLGSTESKKTKGKNCENVPHFEITDVVLVQCNIVNNDYLQDLRALYTFVSKKPSDSLLEISPKNLFKNIQFRISSY